MTMLITESYSGMSEKIRLYMTYCFLCFNYFIEGCYNRPIVAFLTNQFSKSSANNKG